MDEIERPNTSRKPRKMNNLGLKMVLRSLDANNVKPVSGVPVSAIFDLALTEEEKDALNALTNGSVQPGMATLMASRSLPKRAELARIQDAIDHATELLAESAKPFEPAPPSAFWFELVVSVTVSGDFLANLEMIYFEKWLAKYGRRKANILWHSQCARMALRHWVDRAAEMITVIRKIIW